MRVGIFLQGLIGSVTFPILCLWWHSMYTGSCLARGEVVEVIKKIRSTDPTSDEWEEASPPRTCHSLD